MLFGSGFRNLGYGFTDLGVFLVRFGLRDLEVFLFRLGVEGFQQPPKTLNLKTLPAEELAVRAWAVLRSSPILRCISRVV